MGIKRASREAESVWNGERFSALWKIPRASSATIPILEYFFSQHAFAGNLGALVFAQRNVMNGFRQSEEIACKSMGSHKLVFVIN